MSSAPTAPKMEVREVAPGQYSVRNHKGTFCGTIEKQEFVSYPKGKPVKRKFWMARARGAGWREASVQKFKTKNEAASFIIDQAFKPYNKQRMAWKPKATCRKGHKLKGDNLASDKDGRKRCRKCQNERSKSKKKPDYVS